MFGMSLDAPGFCHNAPKHFMPTALSVPAQCVNKSRARRQFVVARSIYEVIAHPLPPTVWWHRKSAAINNLSTTAWPRGALPAHHGRNLAHFRRAPPSCLKSSWARRHRWQRAQRFSSHVHRGESAYLAFSTISTRRKRLVAESGRVSLMMTRSPMPALFSSS